MEGSTKVVLVLALFLSVFVVELDGRNINDKHTGKEPQIKYQPQTVGIFAPPGGAGAGFFPGSGGLPTVGSLPGSGSGSVPGGLPSFSIPRSLPGFQGTTGSVPIPGGQSVGVSGDNKVSKQP